MAQMRGAATAGHSRFVQRIRRRYAAELPLLPAGVPSAADIAALVGRLQHAGRALPAALRVARQLVVERLCVLDVEAAAPLATVTGCMTALAEATLELALEQALADADARHGAPLSAAGRRVEFWIVGMGKLGARELNVSSDIDLVYVFESDRNDGDGSGAQTAGPRPVSLQEYFALVAKRLYALIGETTDDGFVFRVDLALRPNGNSGPPAVSLAMLDDYFQAQGREWERFAWLKSRVVAPRAAVHSGRALALRALVTPFVYRRYLDYGVFEGLRQLHRRIRDEAQRRAAGRPERANDVKLSRGGIREIEFTVQLLLVVRGGQFPEIRTRSTLRGLQRLADRGLMKADTARQLAAGYTLLRRVEHRIQYLDDQQTHLLPGADDDLDWIACSLGADLADLADGADLARGADGGGAGGGSGTSDGADAAATAAAPAGAAAAFVDAAAAPDENAAALRDGRAITGHAAGRPGTCRLLSRLGEVRELVAAEFDALLREGRGDAAALLPNGCRSCGPGPQPIDSESLLDKLPPALAERLRPWAAHARVKALRDESRLRLGRLMQAAAAGVADGSCTLQACLRFVDWVEPLLRRESYLALLVERPDVLRRLLRLLGMARWPAQYLLQHPGVIDELADARLLHQRFDAAAFTAELDERRAAWERSGEADEDKLLDTLRRAHHAEVFRTLVRDVEGTLTVEQVADDLSALADALLDTTVRWCWALLKQRHRAEPLLGVIAYGKLGGKELGYGSDLDVVFLYDDGAVQGDAAAAAADAAHAGPGAQEIYGLFVRKLITWLTLRTAAGALFDIDTALRPNGNSGLLVTSIAAFDRYQRGRGSNTAWTWEHQAITRARFAAGHRTMAAAFDNTRAAVLTAVRDPAALRGEVCAMRAKLRAARPVPAGRFDVKHSPGGMVDVEFAVQYLVLAHGRNVAPLLDNAGNIALLQRAEAAGLLPPGVGHAAADAYRELRRAQHGARLDEQPTQFDPAGFAAPRDAVLALWHAVFG